MLEHDPAIELVHDDSTDVFLRIDATSNTVVPDGIPTISVRSLTTSVEEQRDALLAYARNAGIEPAFASDCNFRGAEPYVFLTSDVASQCDLAKAPLDRRVIVAVSPPPTASVLEMATSLLGSLGREITRSALIELLERQKARHHVWLMTLDTSSRLVPLN